MGVIYKALKKAEREAMHLKEKSTIQEVASTSQADTHQVGPPSASVKKATADKKPSSMKGKSYKAPYMRMCKKFFRFCKCFNIFQSAVITKDSHAFRVNVTYSEKLSFRYSGI